MKYKSVWYIFLLLKTKVSFVQLSITRSGEHTGWSVSLLNWNLKGPLSWPTRIPWDSERSWLNFQICFYHKRNRSIFRLSTLAFICMVDPLIQVPRNFQSTGLVSVGKGQPAYYSNQQTLNSEQIHSDDTYSSVKIDEHNRKCLEVCTRFA